MTTATHTLNTLAFDAQGLDALKIKAKTNPTDSIAAASKQVEGLFLGMVMKSMRAATMQDGPFESEQTRLYTSMLDQQLAQHMAKRGTGLAEVMTRQLSAATGTAGTTDGNRPAVPAEGTLPAGAAAAGASRNTPPGDFVSRMWSHAVEAAQSLGVKPQFIVGQAALESGWGKYEIRTADGQPSHNLFGIKAAGNWKGPSVEKTTIEYVNGVPIKMSDRFRVYGSYTEAFRDYASLLKDNARYSGVIGQNDARAFASGLQRGGYATDPAYADKLVSVINMTRDAAAPADMQSSTVLAQLTAPLSVPSLVRPPVLAPTIMPVTHAPAAPYVGGLVRVAYGAAAAGPITLREPAPPASLVQPPPVQPAATSATTTRQPENFVNRVWSHAVGAAQELGVQPQFLIGQAALETGWGKHETRTTDGQPSHNLFGIRAGADWNGPTVDRTVVTMRSGVAVKTIEKFRVYASYDEGFRDYAKFLRANTRYAGAAGQADARGYAQGLQRGGYATDPLYADKLVSVINSPPLRQAATHAIASATVGAARESQLVAQR